MNFSSFKMQAFFSGKQALASGLTLIAELIAATPLCGYLFACGCTWPGLGLDSACNFHQPETLHRCPWCASAMAGGLSLGIAVSAGVFASAYTRSRFDGKEPQAFIGPDRVKTPNLI